MPLSLEDTDLIQVQRLKWHCCVETRSGITDPQGFMLASCLLISNHFHSLLIGDDWAYSSGNFLCVRRQESSYRIWASAITTGEVRYNLVLLVA